MCLLGTRRIGQGYSLHEHPYLEEFIKEKQILIETCPISNKYLRLCTSVTVHTAQALINHGVATCLNGDDPYLMQHGMSGLTPDFWAALWSWENLGLGGLVSGFVS